jgi:hypothetical protein
MRVTVPLGSNRIPTLALTGAFVPGPRSFVITILAISYVSLAGIGAPFGERGTPVLAFDEPAFRGRSWLVISIVIFSVALIAFLLTLRAGR